MKEETNEGYCHDCAQGIITKPHAGFEFYDDGEGSGHWFCRYCGSNHVTVKIDGRTIEEGDLYAPPTKVTGLN